MKLNEAILAIKKIDEYLQEKGKLLGYIRLYKVLTHNARAEKALETLSPRERSIIELRFGLIDGRPQTLEEVGRKFKVTRERIRVIEAKAIRKLKHPSRFSKFF